MNGKMSTMVTMTGLALVAVVAGCSAETATPSGTDSTESPSASTNPGAGAIGASEVESKARTEGAALVARQSRIEVSQVVTTTVATPEPEAQVPGGEQRCRNYIDAGAYCTSCSWGWIGHTSGGICSFCTDYSAFGCVTF